MRETEVRKVVREGYARVAKASGSCCSPQSVCCGGANPADSIGKNIGYSDADMRAVPEGANLGLGCGNPVALALLEEGDIVLDLGSGAGFDCFLAASRVGNRGKVIGVDMTPEMVERARDNAGKGNYGNVEFRLGEIEHLPVADNTADVLISNCVINLSPDKEAVFKEAFRTLKPGGRLMVSDIVLLNELPMAVKNSVAAYVGCISGASMRDKYIGAIKAAGFQCVEILSEAEFPLECMANDLAATALISDSDILLTDLKNPANSVRSIAVKAVKMK